MSIEFTDKGKDTEVAVVEYEACDIIFTAVYFLTCHTHYEFHHVRDSPSHFCLRWGHKKIVAVLEMEHTDYVSDRDAWILHVERQEGGF